LWEDGDCFEEDGERPEDFIRRECIVEDQGENDARVEKVVCTKGIDSGVMSGSVFKRRVGKFRVSWE
jgi:hypothetical protein